MESRSFISTSRPGPLHSGPFYTAKRILAGLPFLVQLRIWRNELMENTEELLDNSAKAGLILIEKAVEWANAHRDTLVQMMEQGCKLSEAFYFALMDYDTAEIALDEAANNGDLTDSNPVTKADVAQWISEAIQEFSDQHGIDKLWLNGRPMPANSSA
jgi:hypothetical protein